MTISRRRFVASGAALAAATSLSSTAIAADETPAAETPVVEPQAVAAPPLEVIVLNRMGYGPRPGDLVALKQQGLAAYVAEQLSPVDSQDTLYNQKLGSTLLRIEYGPSQNRVRQDLPFTHLDKPVEELWPLARYDNGMDGAQRNRPLDEVIATTWLRAVYSKWQLREVLVDFWHNHFNVFCYTNQEVQSTWPLYDKVMRRNCFGNFRSMLEEVAKSIAMQYYLNNQSNQSGNPNENYARELFELHTLGSINYFNNLYKNWEAVPGADKKAPIGYIDDDVYEAARAMTGWTIEDGSRHGSVTLPNTGNFRYNDSGHDRFQKRILANDTGFRANQTAEADGKKLLDLVASHPGTARFICTKLCRRLVADNPSPTLVDKAVVAWTANAAAPDQIKKVLEVILLSDEFKAGWGAKVKRPMELFVSFIRASGIEFPPAGIFRTDLAYGFAEAAGQRLFYWRTPTGYPDTATYWLSTNVTLRRWNSLNRLMARDMWGLPGTDPLPFPVRTMTPSNLTSTEQIVDYWIDRMLGRKIAPEAREEIMRFLAQSRGFGVAPTSSDQAELSERFAYMVALIGMVPDFQWR